MKEGENWKPVPDNKVYVIDLKANPPQRIATVEVGKQPSGLDISKKGDLALVTLRAAGVGRQVGQFDAGPTGGLEIGRRLQRRVD